MKLFFLVPALIVSTNIAAMQQPNQQLVHVRHVGFSCGVFGGFYDGSVNHGHAGTGFFLGVMLPSFVYAEKTMTPPEKIAFFKSSLAGYIATSLLIIRLAKATF